MSNKLCLCVMTLIAMVAISCSSTATTIKKQPSIYDSNQIDKKLQRIRKEGEKAFQEYEQ